MRKVQLLLACLVFSVAAFAADKVIRLPKPNLNRNSEVMEAFANRHSTREYAAKALTLTDLSDLLCVNKKPGEPLDTLTREFIKFIVSKDGQEIVTKDGYYPIPAKVSADVLKSIE